MDKIIKLLGDVLNIPFTQENEAQIEIELRAIIEVLPSNTSVLGNVLDNTLRDLCYNGINGYHYDVLVLSHEYLKVTNS